jgi:hypothetical protein
MSTSSLPLGAAVPKQSEQIYLSALSQMVSGYARTQVLYLTAKLGLADHLAHGSRHADDLAVVVDAHPTALRRFLRVMVAMQLATQCGGERFELAPLGQFLRADHPASLRRTILYTGEVNYPAAGGLWHSLRTGEPAFDHVFGRPYFEHFGRHPEVGGLFNELMSRATRQRAGAVIRAYDFASARQVIDLGGGNGTLLAAILKAHPGLRGRVYDRAPVREEAEAFLAAQGVGDRAEFVAGSFFDSVPAGGDLYLLSNILHDWDDEPAARILANCTAVMSATSRLLIVEEVMPERVSDGPGVVLSDLAMMMLTGGFERTREEYRHLLTGSGLELQTVRPMALGPTPGAQPTWAVLEAALPQLAEPRPR